MTEATNVATLVRSERAGIGILFLGNATPLMALLVILMVGSVSTVAHGGKTGGRVAMNVLTPYENVTNLGMALGENAFSISLTLFALKYPYVASAIAVVVLILIIILIPQLMRWSFFIVSSIFAKIKSLFGGKMTPDTLPTEYWRTAAHRVPEIAVKCRAHGIGRSNGRRGYVAKYGPNLVFIYKAFFSTYLWQVNTGQLLAGHLESRSLMDVIGFHYVDKENRRKVVRFVFQKDRSLLAKSLLDAVKKSRDEQRTKALQQ